GKGLQELRNLPTAELNLVLAPWVDLDIAKKLEKKFGTPWVHFPCMPIGPTAEAELIRVLTEKANLDPLRTEAVIKERTDRYNYYFDRNIVWLFDMHNQRSLPREFFVNTSASAALSVTKYLVRDLGLSPRKIFIPEDVPEKYQETVRNLFLQEAGEYISGDDIIFTDDGGLLEEHLKTVDQTVRKSAIFGSVWDDLPAKKYSMPFVPVGTPYGDILVSDKTYFGTDGAPGLMSDLYHEAEIKGLVSAVV
ncbi:MAG: nitrogenase molybdenum-iron protein, alpha and beta chain, partial [Parasporobacterium sp.]|nr:nitrogenase molybdenum-iron protein, alpha and beta chain [Parasporobacterium sp.]